MIDLKKIFNKVLSEALVTEDQDSKSQDKARKYVAQKFGLSSSTDKIKLDDNHEYTADEVVKHIRTICFNLKISKFKDSNKQCGKFTLGYVRLFLDDPTLESDGEICQFLNWCVFQFTEQYEKFDQNLNGLNLEEIKNQFYSKYKEYIQNIYEDIRKTDYSKTPSNYTCVKIKKQSELKKYSVYTSWCITSDIDMYKEYTKNGWNQFFVFLQNGFDKLDKPSDSDHPNAKDKYGLSMIAVSVTSKGLLNTCTGRWNHDYGGNDSLLNAKELSDILKIRFTDVADTRDNKDLGNKLISQIEKTKTIDKLSKIRGFSKIKDTQLATIKFKGKELLIKILGNNAFEIAKDQFDNYQWFDNVEKHNLENTCIVSINNNKMLIDSFGKMLTRRKYTYIYSFSDGLAEVELNRKYGFIDKTGKEVIEPKYVEAHSFSDGLALVRLNDKYGFIDKSGKEAIEQKYDEADNFSEGLAKVKLNGKWGFIDKSGKEIVKPKYDEVDSFSEGLAEVELNGKCGFIDKSGKEVIEQKYYIVGNFSEGLAEVCLNEKWGFINKSGTEVVKPKYDEAYSFSEGLAKVCLNDKYGFIDKSGKEVIEPKYDYADSFLKGLAMVRLNDKYGFIDKSGTEVVKPKYDYINSFSEGLAIVRLNDKYGFIDKSGKEIVKPKYDEAYSFSEGLAKVKLNGKWRVIDKTGTEVN